MRGAFIVIASLAISTLAADLGRSEGRHQPMAAEKLDFIFPGNIDCRDFDRIAYKVWQLRDRVSLDLGNWDNAFVIKGPISQGLFVRRGFDLFDVLEAKCGLSA